MKEGKSISTGRKAPPPSEPRKFLGVTQLAIRWGVSNATIHRMIDEGSIKGMKVRSSYKISIEAIKRFEQASEL